MRSSKKVFPASEAKQFTPAVFKSFDRRPVNYFRDMIVDEEQQNAVRLNEQEFNTKIEQLLTHEKQKLTQKHEQDLRGQYEAGVAAGKLASSAEFQRGLELMSEYARVLQSEKQEIAERAERNSIELAFMLARKIIGLELEAKPELVGTIARMAIEQVLDCDRIELKVNNEDLGYLKSVQQDLESLLSGQAKLELRADKSLERGSCMIETERGLLDARISTQLDALRESLNKGETAKA
jgi:flagellar assembly protein FliH